jgi:hypothetical protein
VHPLGYGQGGVAFARKLISPERHSAQAERPGWYRGAVRNPPLALSLRDAGAESGQNRTMSPTGGPTQYYRKVFMDGVGSRTKTKGRGLTRNERYYLAFLCAGLTNEEISIAMLAKRNTVQRWTQSVYRRVMDVESMAIPAIKPKVARQIVERRRPMAIRKGII